MLKRKLQTSLSLCAAIVFSFVPSQAGDWPQWRGPQRDGKSGDTGLLQQWPSGGPKLAWKTTGLGAGYSSVAVAGGRVFTMGDKNDASHVLAFEEASGQQAWTTKIGKAGASGGYEGPRSTPTVDGDRVYALGQFGELVCLDIKSGKEHWRRDLVKDFGGTLPGWGYAESVLVDGGNVVCTPGGSRGTVLSLDKATGKEVWRSKEFKDPAHYSSLIAVEIDGVKQYIQLTERSVAGVAVSDGKLLWIAPRRGATAVIPTPVYHDHHVFVTSGYGIGCNLFKVAKAGDTFKAEEVYANKVMANHHGGVVLLGDHLYGYSDGKGWTCQELKSGKALWQDKQLGKGAISFADGRLYCRAESGKGTVVLLEPVPGGYKEHGRFDPPDRIDRNTWAHPVVANGKLYLRDNDVLLSYDIRK